MSGTKKIQKMVNYTVNNDQTEMLFCFTSFDLRGNNEWALVYNTGNVYNGKGSFAIENVQTMVVVTKPNGQGEVTKKFSKTTVNGLTVLLNNDNNCETIRDLAYQRIPKVLENSLQTFFEEKIKMVMNEQFALIGLKYKNWLKVILNI